METDPVFMRVVRVRDSPFADESLIVLRTPGEVNMAESTAPK